MVNALQTLFQDIADAIRTKTGDTAIMKPSEFPDRIAEIALGGNESDFDALDASLKCFTYRINAENMTIEICSILYDDIYADTGSYDVTIPDTLGGYNVIIRCE